MTDNDFRIRAVWWLSDGCQMAGLMAVWMGRHGILIFSCLLFTVCSVWRNMQYHEFIWILGNKWQLQKVVINQKIFIKHYYFIILLNVLNTSWSFPSEQFSAVQCSCKTQNQNKQTSILANIRRLTWFWKIHGNS